MGRRKKNRNTEAQSENSSLIAPSTAINSSKKQQLQSENKLGHKDICNALNLQSRNESFPLKTEAENVASLCEQNNSAENVIACLLQNHPEDEAKRAHLGEEHNAEMSEEGHEAVTFGTANEKEKQHKARVQGQGKTKECRTASNLEGERSPESNTERGGIQDNCTSKSLHDKTETSRKRKSKRSDRKENSAQLSEAQDKVLHDKKSLRVDSKSQCEAANARKEMLNESVGKRFSIKTESVADINKGPEAPQHEEQDKREAQEPSIVNVCRSLSQEQIANITKTAVNLSQSLGKNQNSNLALTPELMRSLLCPAPKDTETRENELQYKVTQRQIFLNYACHVCKTIQSDSCRLKRCSNCKMICYCSKEHQREHWPVHKDLCKAISKISKAEGMAHLFQKAIGLSPDEYRRYRIHYINICTNVLGRELELWEKEMFFFPQVCHTCYEVQSYKLKMCEKCNSVCYCKPNHFKTDHEAWCNDLQIYRDLIIHQFHNGIIQPHLPQIIYQKYIPLEGDMRSFLLKICVGADRVFDLDRFQYVALTDLATCPLSALFSLQQCKFPLETAPFLVIHIIGAEMHFEGNVLAKWEAFMLHLLPSITMLHVVFIGPELHLDTASSPVETKHTSCPDCSNSGKQLTFSFWSGYYHDYVKCEQYQKPNLITAFNDGLYRSTGFLGKDTWLPTLEVMLRDASVPVVLTEYTAEELPLDIKRMEKLCPLNVIVPPSKNPFSSTKPSLNFLSDETVPVIFKNYYIAVLHRK